jgi:hypothetical protein
MFTTRISSCFRGCNDVRKPDVAHFKFDLMCVSAPYKQQSGFLYFVKLIIIVTGIIVINQFK